MGRSAKKLPSYKVNGWTIDKNPNTFAERHVYSVTACDDAGFQTARHGFDRLRDARKFCTEAAAPLSRQPAAPEPAAPKPAAAPCASCPYRRDVPSGVWARSEYEKLPSYDGPTWGQSPQLFMCHQQDGCLCAGWLACHDTDHLLALRMQAVDPSARGYVSPVPVFASGAEAMAHGIAEIDAPGEDACRVISRVQRKQAKPAPARPLHRRGRPSPEEV